MINFKLAQLLQKKFLLAKCFVLFNYLLIIQNLFKIQNIFTKIIKVLIKKF